MAPDREGLQQRIRGLFLAELDDAVRSLNEQLLRLEHVPPSEAGPLVREMFRIAHGVKGAAHAANVPEAAAAAHQLEERLAAARDGRVVVDAARVAEMLADVDALGRARPTAAAPAVPSAPAAPVPPTEPPGTTPAAPLTARAAVRVDAGKLDALLDRAGDLTLASGRVATLVRELHDATAGTRPVGAAELAAMVRRATQTSREITRVSADLANAAAALTFQPFAEACAGLDRVVHDLAAARGRRVVLEVRGRDVELDRAVAVALREPLLHLVRNAVDHGIEPPDVRLAAGKPEIGRVTVAAALHDAGLEVRVEDDGRGLDREAIRAAAARQGVDTPGDEEDLIFLPGLTTSAEVTAVSGRGVGLDAIRARLHGLGGSVTLESRAGGGTTVILRCPVSLAMSRVLVARAGGETVCLPMTAITRLLHADPAELRDLDGVPALVRDGAVVPVVPLAAAAGLGTAGPLARARLRLVLVATGGRQAALAVDELVGELDAVVKDRPSRLAGLHTVLGATTLPDGRGALVLNVAECVRRGLEEARDGWPARLTDGDRRAPRVLVADDTVTTRTLEAGILDAAGYDVLTARDGAEAWEVLQREPVDLVLSDVHMPRLDGVELCRMIRASERWRDLPVVLLTSLGSDDDRRRGLEAGASAYLVKSEFDQQTLLDVIEQSL